MGIGQRSGPPSWFVILVGVAIVFGVYYMWVGLRNFMASGVSVSESTQQAIEQSTATAARIQEIVLNAPTPLPSFTPVPPCQDFIVRVPIAIVRAEPSLSGRIIEGLREGETVCVLTMLPDSEWYMIDQNMQTRRIERVYMHRDIIRALNPTPKPTATAIPTDTSTSTITPTATDTRPPTAAPPALQTTATERPLLPSPTATAKATVTAPSISL